MLGLGLAAVVGISTASARAQPAGARPLKLLVPFPAGGASDALARQVAPALSQAMGQTVVVENITGASGTLAVQRLMSSPPDGTSILVASPSETILPPLLMRSVKWQPEDFRLLVGGMSVPLALVARASAPFSTAQELLAHLRAPDQAPLSCGNLGNGSVSHLAAGHFERLTGGKLVHVPYRGGLPLTTDLVGQQIDLSFFPFAGPALQMAEAGTIKVLGVASSTQLEHLARHPLLPEVAGLRGFVHSTWSSFAVPKAVPDAIAERLNRELNTILQSAPLKALALRQGSSVPEPMSLLQVGAFYAAETSQLRALAGAIQLQPE